MLDAPRSPALAGRAGPARPAAAPLRVAGVALAAPPAAYTQAEMLDLLGLAGDPFAEGVFARSGVHSRRLGLEPAALATTLQERTPATEAQLGLLAEEAIGRLGADPEEIGVVVTATYYSLGGPTLAHRIVERLGLAPDTDKYQLVGVGCASAVPLFRLAGQALRDRPGQSALVVAAEVVSGFLTAAQAGDPKVKVVGSALFGDGCGAALLRAGGPALGPAVVATAVHQVPDTLDHVRFGVTGADSHMRIARELPAVAEEGLAPLVDAMLAEQGLDRAAIDHWLVHPGGRGIVEGVQHGLGLSDEQVAPSVAVLERYGNVGTPASFFVLAETVAARHPAAGELGLMMTIGPGVTVGLMVLAW
jgi:predicted naringenin-chalcone synthase